MPGSSRDEKDLDCLERDASTLTFENTSCNVFRRVEANELLLSETPVYKNR